ncbi:hypothetical protein Sste5346_009701 [Sporothrix stenoceras]|uniref:Zinc metallopeptidase n=1 Tax=Sporothrix stenoceras TaxID=5173 RepID=A0ABR3YJ36_9PEZI
MPEHDPVVLAYSHLRDFPRATDALHLLRRVASLVKPLMRARRWKVRELSEFYPDQNNLLGLNINKGQKILLRLRYPGDASLFLPLEQVADTLLHELAHIVHGPHDAIFHALWNQLRDEHMALTLKGFTGEGFLSEGHRLGGVFDNGGSNNWGATGITSGGPSSSSSTPNVVKRPIPMDEARRLARAAAERRQAKASEKERESKNRNSTGGGHRLGGSIPTPANDMRSVVADAVARRNSHTPETMQGCATDGPQYSDQTRKWLADQAARNGFRTQAEEDAANDAAIAQALWELVQEDEKQRLGDQYVPPTAERPEGSGGWLSSQAPSSTRDQSGSSSSPIIIDVDVMDVDPPRGPPPKQRRPAPPPPKQAQARPSSMSAPPAAITRRPAPPPPAPKPANLTSSTRPRSNSSSATSSASSIRGWTCSICTLHNPSTYLVCDACGVEKSSSSSPPRQAVISAPPPPSSSSSSHRHSMPPPPLAHRPAPPPPTSAQLPPSSRRSHAAPNAATAATSRASAMRKSGQPAKKPRVKKQVRFTPSTVGGSVTSTTSASSRARPRSPPPATFSTGVDSVVSNGSSSNGGSSIDSSFDKILAKHRPAPPLPNMPPAMPPRPQAGQSRPSQTSSSSSSSSTAPASATWMCTMCWTNMGRKHTTCGSCGRPREAWQN